MKNKKGQGETALLLLSGYGAIVLVVVLIAYGSYKIIETSKITTLATLEDINYIGDFDTSLVYDSSKCRTDFIKNKIYFDSLDTAYNSKFKEGICIKK